MFVPKLFAQSSVAKRTACRNFEHRDGTAASSKDNHKEIIGEYAPIGWGHYGLIFVVTVFGDCEHHLI